MDRSEASPILGLTLGACDKSNPVTPPPNRDPLILSLTVFPTAIGPPDSAVAICDATDSDADSLVYDWITDTRLRIKGAGIIGTRLINSPSSSQIFYYGTPSDSFGTAWIQCITRDRRGGQMVAWCTSHSTTDTGAAFTRARRPLCRLVISPTDPDPAPAGVVRQHRLLVAAVARRTDAEGGVRLGQPLNEPCAVPGIGRTIGQRRRAVAFWFASVAARFASCWIGHVLRRQRSQRLLGWQAIAFAATRGSGQPWRVWVVDENGGDLRPLTGDESTASSAAPRHSAADDLDPCWLPDGRVAFASTRFGQVAMIGGAPATNLFATAPSGTPTRISSERNGADEPSVDPRTGRIVYARWWFNRYFATDVDSSGLTLLPARAVPMDAVNLWHAITIRPTATGESWRRESARASPDRRVRGGDPERRDAGWCRRRAPAFSPTPGKLSSGHSRAGSPRRR